MIDNLLLKVRRGETPLYRSLRSAARSVQSSNLPLPRAIHPLLRLGFDVQSGIANGARWFLSFFIREPLFRGRCESVGRRFRMFRLPFIVGHTKIFIGDDVKFFGKV